MPEDVRQMKFGDGEGSERAREKISTLVGPAQEYAPLQSLHHRMLLQAQRGSLHPERIPVNTMERVLDVGCSAGDWIFDLARRYPKLRKIYGIDLSEAALQEAQARRNAAGFGPRIELRHMDFTQPLNIPDAYFDFVHVRNSSFAVRPYQWPSLLGECIRVLKVGGWLAVVEIELGEFSSSAFMSLQWVMTQAMNNMGLGMDATGVSRGPASRLYRMLLQAGLEGVGYDLHTIDLGFQGGNIVYVFLTEILRHTAFLRSVAVQQGILGAKEFDELVAQTQADLGSPGNCGWGLVVSAYGRRGDASE